MLLALIAGQTNTLWLLYAASVLRGIAFAIALIITTVGALGFYYLYRKLINAQE